MYLRSLLFRSPIPYLILFPRPLSKWRARCLPSDLFDDDSLTRSAGSTSLHSRMSLGSLTEKDLKGAIDEAAAEAAAACAAMSQGGNFQDEDEVALAVRAGAPRHPCNV